MTRFCKSSGLPTPTAGCDCELCLDAPGTGKTTRFVLDTLTPFVAYETPRVDQDRAWNEALETKRKQA